MLIVSTDTRPLLLDLFCGAGGASRGYYQAGFDLMGIDINAMPRYPYAFAQGDAIDYLEAEISSGNIHRFSAIHASPPCQRYSVTKTLHSREYPDLINPLRLVLQKTQLPYVIENVVQAPLTDPLILCGSQFNLSKRWNGDYWCGDVYLKRHRAFEMSIAVPDPGPHDHNKIAVTVAGHGRIGGRTERFRGRGYNQLKRDIMAIDWMRESELNEAIPPAYTQYIGSFLMKHLKVGFCNG